MNKSIMNYTAPSGAKFSAHKNAWGYLYCIAIEGKADYLNLQEWAKRHKNYLMKGKFWFDTLSGHYSIITRTEHENWEIYSASREKINEVFWTALHEGSSPKEAEAIQRRAAYRMPYGMTIIDEIYR
jgi:aryl-alcohol dehydrogenase-like predicted oxidoreductase